MAGWLKPKRSVVARWACAVLLALLGHVLVLDWFSATLGSAKSILSPMSKPMLTREVTVLPPLALPTPSPGAVPSPRPRRAAKAATPVTVPEPTVAEAPAPAPAPTPAPAPAPAAPEPLPAVATAPEPDMPASVTPSIVSTASNSTATTGTDTSATLPTFADGTPDVWPSDTRLSYQLGGNFRGALHGSADVLWQRKKPLSENAYQVQVSVDIGFLASLKFTSQGAVQSGGLQPQAYEEQVRNNRRSVTIKEQSVVLQDGTVLPRPDGVQDTASQFVELAFRFATGRDTLAAGSVVNLWLARPGGVDQWVYDVSALEELQLAGSLGTVQVHHLKPRPIANARGTITAEIWFAPEMQYLPVRIRMNVNPETYIDLLLSKIEQ